MRRNIRLEEISDGRLYTANDMVKADCRDCEGCSACLPKHGGGGTGSIGYRKSVSGTWKDL